MSRRIVLVNSLVKKSELKVLLSLFNVHSNDIPELRNKNELKKYFGSINEDNQNIFCQAVEQNEIELVQNILEINPDLINIITESSNHNILHIAVLGIASDEMVKMLLQNKPTLITEKDKKEFTPFMLKKECEKGCELIDKKVNEVLENYEKTFMPYEFTAEDFSSEEIIEYLIYDNIYNKLN
ncbi:hypothetical protein [Rickettsia endosymbiont of Gonocerus acuteangulatus]|uniref:hypothetical protein n=1 Tax=Rickettsia endosymbiont of Gonocerus acuteangulatus TaxID=3066266 RepID=UPI003132DD29